MSDRIDRRYELLRPIARGGAGSVFEAMHLVTKRHVAVKVLNGDLRGHSEARARLLREARALTLVTHPNVVSVVDGGVDDVWGPFLAMELLEGRLLGGILAARMKLAPDEAVAVALQVCDALSAAHARGVVHRDVKPDNIFIARNSVGIEAVKLLDFGVASFPGAPDAPEQARLTGVGSLLGTPEYMAPEQLTGERDVDGRCDVYGLGVTLYECLTGEIPYDGNVARIVQQLWTMPAPSPRTRCPELAEPLVEVVVRSMARPPDDRFPSIKAMADALRAALPAHGRHGSLLRIAADDVAHEKRPTAPTRPLESRTRERGATAPTRPVDLPTRPSRVTPATRPIELRTPAAPPDTEAPNSMQRRRYLRVPYVTPVTLARTNGSTMFGRSEDISIGGMLVVTGRPCEGPEVVTIRFALPETGRFAEVRAVARWARQAHGVGATGFEFVAPPPEAVDAIAAHVSRIAAARPRSEADAPAASPS